MRKIKWGNLIEVLSIPVLSVLTLIKLFQAIFDGRQAPLFIGFLIGTLILIFDIYEEMEKY